MAVVIGHIAAEMSTIRVGSGGMILPNHAPLVIAKQFGTLEALFPRRNDLGLGRVPGADQLTAMALRRGATSADKFQQDVRERQSYFQPTRAGQAVQAVPGAGLGVPIWLLGSSLFSAQLAAVLGLPFAFASYFAPDNLDEALALYRGEFQLFVNLEKAYTMATLPIFLADDDAAAARLFASLQPHFLHLLRGRPGLLPALVKGMDALCSAAERMGVQHAFREAVVGGPATVQSGIKAFLKRTRVDELLVTAAIRDHRAQLRSFELVAPVRAGR